MYNDDEIRIAEYAFRLKHKVPPNTLLLNHTDYWLMISRISMVTLPGDLQRAGVFYYAGMRVIRSADIKRPQVALCETVNL